MGKFRSPWKNKTTVAIVVFLLTLFWFLSGEAKADNSTSVDLSGYAVGVGGERYDSESLIFSETIDDKYRVGLVLQLRLDCVEGSPCKRGESKHSNQAVFLQRVVQKGDFEMGIGISYWHNQTPAWDSHTPFVLNVRYRVNNDFHIGYLHFSTGGSSGNNGGMDILTIGYSF